MYSCIGMTYDTSVAPRQAEQCGQRVLGLDATGVRRIGVWYVAKAVLPVVVGRRTLDADQTPVRPLVYRNLPSQAGAVPVYQGATEGVLGVEKHASYYHGKDGLGDVPDPGAPDASLIQREHAVSAIVRLAKEYMGELDIVALGPLTNLALAVRMDPDIGSKFKGVYVMGGNHLGQGNTVPAAEFNFYADPEGAHATLNGLKDIKLVTWETCMKHSFNWEWFERFTKIPTKAGRFIGKIYQTTIERHYKNQKEGAPTAQFIMADQIIMAALIDPSIVQETKEVYATVETGGKYCRGQMVVDWQGKFEMAPNVHLLTSLKKWKLSWMSQNALRRI